MFDLLSWVIELFLEFWGFFRNFLAAASAWGPQACMCEWYFIALWHGVTHSVLSITGSWRRLVLLLGHEQPQLDQASEWVCQCGWVPPGRNPFPQHHSGCHHRGKVMEGNVRPRSALAWTQSVRLCIVCVNNVPNSIHPHWKGFMNLLLPKASRIKIGRWQNVV